ncbi:AimR family lysis-lysogeny pheromone receptor [Priestia megaterium]
MLEVNISLKEDLIKAIDSQGRGALTKLAKKIGVDHSIISKFQKNEKREIDGFRNLLSITKEVFPDKFEHYVDEYCEALSPNGKTLKSALEYASVHQKVELEKKLINKLRQHKKAEVKEIADLYEFNTSRLSNKYEENLKKVYSFDLTSIESKVFSKIIHTSIYHLEGEYKKAIDTLTGVDLLLEESEMEEYLKSSYKTRIASLKVALSLSLGELNNTVQHGKDILDQNIDSPLNIWILMNIGNAYMITNYEKSMMFLKEAKQECIKRNDMNKLVQVERSMFFSKCYWSKEVNPNEITGHEISDLHNKAFAYIANGKPNNAMTILDSIDVEKLNHDKKSFYYFYKGLITKNKEDFYMSIDSFMEIGDKHYRQLPLNELRKLGENGVLLKTLS